MHFVKLTREPWPRLSLVRRVLDDDADYLGPFSSRKTAEKCLAALHDTFPVRQCSDRLGTRAVPRRRACWPRWAGASRRATAASTSTTYAAVVRLLRDTLLRRPDDVVEAINAPDGPALAADERFEEAGVHRDRLAAFVRAAARTQRLTALTRCPEVVAARREDDGRWAVHVVRYGRLAAAGVIPPGADAHALRRRACGRPPRPSRPRPGRCRPRPPRRPRRCCAGWSPTGVRLVDVEGEWTCPVAGATRHLALHDAVDQSRRLAGALRRPPRPHDRAPAR